MAKTAKKNAALRKEPPSETPYVVVLGTSQDGGHPQVGCEEQHCLEALVGLRPRRLVASIALCDPRSNRRWLFDATPDLPVQVHHLRQHPQDRAAMGTQAPLFDGIFLTHAHIGHYTGLMYLGREAYAAHQIPVWATSRMRAFLSNNGPWSQLIRSENIVLKTLLPERPVALSDDLSVTATEVPHRDEFSDTAAFFIQGPKRTLLYLPDIDGWGYWQHDVASVIASVDIALIDGTFFSPDDIKGRCPTDIPHPFIVDSLRCFASLSARDRQKIAFTHFNHNNPAVEPGSKEGAAIEKTGVRMAHDLEVHVL